MNRKPAFFALVLTAVAAVAPAAPAQAQGNVPGGCRRFRLPRPLRCCALPGKSAAWRLRKG